MSDVVKMLKKAAKPLFIFIILIVICILLLNNQIKYDHSSGFDLKASLVISVGFATSFRAMMCCRKKV